MKWYEAPPYSTKGPDGRSWLGGEDREGRLGVWLVRPKFFPTVGEWWVLIHLDTDTEGGDWIGHYDTHEEAKAEAEKRWLIRPLPYDPFGGYPVYVVFRKGQKLGTFQWNNDQWLFIPENSYGERYLHDRLLPGLRNLRLLGTA